MTKPRPEKKRGPSTRRILPMELRIGDRLVDETGEWEKLRRRFGRSFGAQPRQRRRSRYQVSRRPTRRRVRRGPSTPSSRLTRAVARETAVGWTAEGLPPGLRPRHGARRLSADRRYSDHRPQDPGHASALRDRERSRPPRGPPE